jgi:hypothetical protein
VSIFNKTIDKLFPAEESTGTESEIKRLRARLATVEAALLAADRLASYMLDVCRADTDQKHAAAYRMARRSALAGDAPGEGK